MPLTSWPAPVGFAIKLDRSMVIWVGLVLIVAEADSGPSPPVPLALNMKTAAFAEVASAKQLTLAITAKVFLVISSQPSIRYSSNGCC
jgi:hypothetical protein